MACCILLAAKVNAQGVNIYEMPRVLVTGEAVNKVEADVIYGWLNIYDNMYSYDYTVPYDDKAFRKKQQEIIERMGLKDALVSPGWSSVVAGTAAGPYQVKFSSRSQFEAAQSKAAAQSSEAVSVSLEFASSDVSAEKRKTITSQLLDQAIQDAKAKAEKLAKGLGGMLGKPIYIEEIRDYYAGPAYDYGMEGGYMPVNDMMVTITARVQVQYELK